MLKLVSLVLLSLLAEFSFAYEIIAHRGVHQAYDRRGLRNETCTASRALAPTHRFLENTLGSMRESFRLGATMVEVDIHPTTEPKGKNSRMVVFHDWTLNCRTNASCENGCQCNRQGECITHEQSLSYMKSLDLGYGYTHDGGKTFPFRGKYVGQMPSLEEVLDLLKEFPDKKLTINVKDKFPRTSEIFLRIVGKYPLAIRRRVYFEFFGNDVAKFKTLAIQEAVYQGKGPAKACMGRYALLGWSGYVPEACNDVSFFVPLEENLGRIYGFLESIKVTDLLWGWPETFIRRMQSSGSHLYVSQVNTAEALERVLELPVQGIMTDKIEIISPLLKNRGFMTSQTR